MVVGCKVKRSMNVAQTKIPLDSRLLNQDSDFKVFERHPKGPAKPLAGLQACRTKSLAYTRFLRNYAKFMG